MSARTGMVPPSNSDAFFFIEAESTHASHVVANDTVDFWRATFHDLQTTMIVTTISSIATIIFNTAFLQVSTFTLACHTLTRLAKKICGDYIFMQTLSDVGLSIAHNMPHVHAIAAAIAVLFCPKIQAIAFTLGAFVGVLSGINYETITFEAMYEYLRQSVNLL